MHKKLGLLFTALSLLTILFPSFAMLKLELTQGVDKRIALVTQSVPTGNASQVANKLIEVVQNDLQNSGRFNVVDNDVANSINQVVDYSKWRDSKIDNVVRYKVANLGAGRYQVLVKLFDIYGRAQLISQQYNTTNANLRRLSHHISDLIYEKLLGIPGVFSTKIAYVFVNRISRNNIKYHLQVADADGFNPQSLLVSSEPIMSPAWSPDGKKIAYVSFEHHRAAIFAQDVSTGKRSVLSRLPGINGAPAWSHDGKKMALVLTKTGVPKIYLLDLASKNLTQLTHGYAIDTEPNFAPDDKSLIFTSNRGGRPQIYRLNLISGKINRVTYKGTYNARASFSPNGKMIVMLHQDERRFTIAVQDLASGRVRILSRIGFDESPSFAPNGAMVVYATNVGGRGILAEVSTDGKVMLKLPAQRGEVQEPAWRL